MMQESVVPQTVEGWLGIVVQTIAIFAAVSAVLHRAVLLPIIENIKAMKETDTTQNATISDMRNKLQASEFDRANLRQELGRVEGVVSRQVQQMEAMRDAAHRDQVEIVERLSRIEANVNVADAMNKLAERLANVLQKRP